MNITLKLSYPNPKLHVSGTLPPNPPTRYARCLLLAYGYGIVRYGVVKIKEPTNSYHHLGHCFRIKRYKFFLIHKKWQFLRTKKTISLRRQKHHLATLFEKVFIMRFFYNIYYIPYRILPENGSLNDVFDAENDWA